MAHENRSEDPLTEFETGKSLVAYIVPTEKPPPTISTFRRILAEKLPDHMIPSAVVMLEAMPLTPTGKVDRLVLPDPDDSRPSLDSPFVVPRTRIEESLAGIWASVLSLEQVGIHDNFFDLGGHSLLASQVISRVRQMFATDLPLRALFEVPTVAGLANRLETLLSTPQEIGRASCRERV